MNRKLPRCKSLASVTSRFVMMLRDVDEVGAAHPDGPGRAIRLRCVTSAGRRRRRRIPNAAPPAPSLTAFVDIMRRAGLAGETDFHIGKRCRYCYRCATESNQGL